MKITKEQILKWKNQYGKVFEYSVKDDKNEMKGYFRSPSLVEIDAFEQTLKRSSLMADDTIINCCWLDGDKEIIQTDRYKAGLRSWLGLLIDRVEGEMLEL